MARTVYRGCVMSADSRVTLADLIELDMLDFDVIFGMDWFHSFYASLDFWT